MEQKPLNLDEMRNVDIRTVDPSTLVDINHIKIDLNRPQMERMADYISQVKNPYCFLSGDIIVKIGYSDTTTTINERMEGYFRSLRAKIV